MGTGRRRRKQLPGESAWGGEPVWRPRVALGTVARSRSHSNGTQVRMNTGLSGDIPLVLDLDGTLLRVDSSRHFLKKACFAGDAAILAALWKGVPWLKAYLASRYAHTLAPSCWNGALMRLAASYRERGAGVWLVTASHALLAKKVYRQFPFLTAFAGSTRRHRLKGDAKARWLTARFGQAGYDYAGDCATDLPCWNAARIAWIPAGLPAGVRKRIRCAVIREY